MYESFLFVFKKLLHQKSIKFLFLFCILLPFLINICFFAKGLIVQGLSDIDDNNSRGDPVHDGDNERKQNTEEEDKSDVDIIIPIAVLGVIMHTMIGHTAEQNRNKYPLLLFLSDSVVAICLGMIAALILKACNKGVIEFNNDIFWYCVLPPIILAQGYTLRKRNFFRLFSATFLFGVIGTFLNFLAISYFAYNLAQVPFIKDNGCTSQLFGGSKVDSNSESGTSFGYDDEKTKVEKICLDNFTPLKAALLGAILSASDGVAALVTIEPDEYPRLGAIILGENVLNEAISLLLFRAIYEDYKSQDQNSVSNVSVIKGASVLVAAAVIGLICGLIPSRLFTIQQSYKLDTVKQSVIVLLFAYLSYVFSEAFEFSGTLAILFCSMTVAHYGSVNLSSKAQYVTKGSFKMLAAIADAFSFVYIGLTVISFSGHYNLYYSLFLFLAVCISRIVNIYLLVFVASLFNRKKKTKGRTSISSSSNNKIVEGGHNGDSLLQTSINSYKTEDAYISDTSGALVHQTDLQGETLDGRPSPSTSISSASISDQLHHHHDNTKKVLMSIYSKYAGKVIPLNHREIIAFAIAGMIRGNVSWAQALQVREEDRIITSTTLTVVLATIFLFQIILPLVVKLLGLKPDEEEEEEDKEEILHAGTTHNESENIDKGEVSRIKFSEDSQTTESNHQSLFTKLLLTFQSFDRNYMRPYFSGSPPNSEKDKHGTYMVLPQDD